jgi:hypothetical protein
MVYKEPKADMQQRAEVYTSPNLETIMSSPDNMKEKTLDYWRIRTKFRISYFKRASSWKERFDLALRTYIER